MRRHRSTLRAGVALLAGLLMAASVAGGTVAAQRGSATTASPGGQASSAKLAKLRSQMKFTYRTSVSRGSVNVRKLAAHAPKARPTKQLPFLTRTPATSGTNGGTTAPKAAIVGPPPPTLATTNADHPAAQPSFDGLGQSSGRLTNGEPPDPWVAVGPDHIVQAVNLTLRVTDRQGGSPINVALPDFFHLPTLPATFDSDPHVVYDSLHGRWIATEVSWDCDTTGGSTFGTGYLDYAISNTTDPTGSWHVDFVAFPDRLPDYPAIGTSTDKVAFPSNVFDMNTAGDCVNGLTFAGSDVNLFDWADLVVGSTDTDASSGVLSYLFTIRAAVQAPATSPTLQLVALTDYVVLTHGSTPGVFDIVYFTIAGSSARGDLRFEVFDELTFDGVVSAAVDPPEPNQAGLDTIGNAVDLRITDAIWQADRLVLVSTYPCGTGPRDCVRVTELNTASVSVTVEPLLTQDFLINESGKDLFMGGVGLSGDGTLHVGWTRSSLTDSPSSFAAHQALGDALGTVSAPELLAAGTAAYGGERWGDFVGIAQDPQVPNQVWNANEYSGGAEWRTKVTPLHTGGTTYIPIAPVRVLNTIAGVGLTGMFTTGIARTWQVAGFGGIPLDAVAVTGNVAVTGQQSAGYLAVTVTPTNSPPSATINFPIGEVRANNVTIPLSSAGKLSAVFKGLSGKKTHLVFDVTGYFRADTSGATFTPMTPVRVLNTGAGVGLTGKFLAGVPRTLTIAGVNGIPGGATAITGNVAVVAPTRAGFASVTKDPTATPSTSTINFPAGATRANGVFAQLNASGELSIDYGAAGSGNVDVVLDVTGYFMPGLGGLKFVPLNPSRIMDTRPTAVLSGLHGKLTSGTPKTLDVDGHWGVPVGAAAVTGNLTVVVPGGGGFLSATPDPDALPSTSTLNFPTGDTMGNGICGPLNGMGNMSFTYKSTPGKTTDLVLDLSGYFQ